MNRLPSGTLEALLAEIGGFESASPRFELWVPQHLTLRGEPTRTDVAMAVVLDKVLGMGYEPDGFTEAEGGRIYRYKATT